MQDNKCMKRRSVLKSVGGVAVGLASAKAVTAKDNGTNPQPDAARVDTSDTPGLITAEVSIVEDGMGLRMVGTIDSQAGGTTFQPRRRTYDVSIPDVDSNTDVKSIAEGVSIATASGEKQRNKPSRSSFGKIDSGYDNNLEGIPQDGEDHLTFRRDGFTILSDEIDEEDDFEDQTGNYELAVESELNGPGTHSSNSYLSHGHSWETSSGSVTSYDGHKRRAYSGNFAPISWGDGGSGFPDDYAYSENWADFRRSCVTCSGFDSHHRLRSEFLPNGNGVWEARIFTRGYDGGPDVREDWEAIFSYSTTFDGEAPGPWWA